MIEIRRIKKIHIVFVILFCVVVSNISFAGGFFDDSKRGWFWYEQNKKQETQQEPDKSQVEGNSTTTASNAKERLKAFQEEIETRKAEMIMYPSIENTRKFLEIQNQMFIRASEVSKTGQLAVLTNPDLNLVAKEQPISQAGLKIARQEQTEREQQLLYKFAKNYQLLFFYSSECSYCKQFSYIVEHYANKYGFKVASVTTDGNQLPNFPASYNRALIERFNVKGTPALFAFSEVRGIAVPIAHGFMSLDLLEKNTVLVASELLPKKEENHETKNNTSR